MSIVMEAALSTLFETIFNKIQSSVIEFANISVKKQQAAEELSKWPQMVESIWHVLDDAEGKRESRKGVKLWMEEIENLAYDIEDIIDVFHYKVESNSVNSKAIKELENITSRLKDLIEWKKQLDLLRSEVRRCSDQTWKRTLSGSVQTESVIYGRENEKRAMVEWLLRNEEDDATARVFPNMGVFPIVGMGGLGKTTLARFVYNDDRVAEAFTLRAWVCVSKDNEISRITKAILQAVTFSSCDLTDLASIQVKLREALSNKRFLLVLDDLWNETYEDWEVLRAPLTTVASGSKIIVTTRNANVADKMRTVDCKILSHLTNEDCWSLFCRHAALIPHENPQLEEIGRCIVKKCGGLPLAAIALGGLLRGKRESKYWEGILNNKSCSFSNVMSVLKLSYYDMPSQVKRCFAFCSLFPEDYEFDSEKVVLMWVGANLVEEEDTGREILQELIRRSMFLYGRKKFHVVMHDLVRDLAIEISGNKSCHLASPHTHLHKTRHLAFDKATILSVVRDLSSSSQPILPMRTFLPLESHSNSPLITGLKNELGRLFPKMNVLRVLSLTRYGASELPESICKLLLLRHLDLSGSAILSLPESISSLNQLKIFYLSYCRKLKELPPEIGKLVNLTHLYVQWSGLVFEGHMPKQIMELKNLTKLSDYVVNENNMELMGGLKHLRGDLTISCLGFAHCPRDARLARLGDKKLEELCLKWNRANEILLRRTATDPFEAKKIVEELRPHENLKKLELVDYGGGSFPSWITPLLLRDLVILKLSNCINCTELPQMGSFPSLKHISVKFMPRVRTIGPEWYGTNQSAIFSKLETLQFESMEAWEEWTPSSCIQFPLLRYLRIVKCPRLLGGLPMLSSMRALSRLHIDHCPLLDITLPKLPSLWMLFVGLCKNIDCVEETTVEWLQSFHLTSLPKMSPLFRQKIQRGSCRARSLLVNGSYLTSNGANTEDAHYLVGWSLPNMFLMSSDDQEILIQDLAVTDESKIINLPQCLCQAKLLKSIEVSRCESMKTLFVEELPETLASIEVRDCTKLVSLSRKGVLSKALKSLEIHNCGALVSISSECMPPCRLERLAVVGCPLVVENLAGSLHKLTSLSSLSLSDCTDDVLQELCSIPNLRELTLIKCSNMETLTVQLPRGLTNLDVINFEKLKLISSSAFDGLSALFRISFTGCPNLKSLPTARLPPIKELHVRNCPLLSYKLEARDEQQWSKISHIPRIIVDAKQLLF